MDKTEHIIRNNIKVSPVIDRERYKYRDFGWALNVHNNILYHCGHDYDCDENDLVYAITDGKIIFASMDVNGFGGYKPGRKGGVIIILHRDKHNNEFIALYGHVKNIRHGIGETVKSTQIIANVGRYMHRDNEINHLHFGININPIIPRSKWGYNETVGSWVDPIGYMKDML
jgi:murein DD-endopeptidase MepM/ murein hydrolase activator NlpD